MKESGYCACSSNEGAGRTVTRPTLLEARSMAMINMMSGCVLKRARQSTPRRTRPLIDSRGWRQPRAMACHFAPTYCVGPDLAATRRMGGASSAGRWSSDSSTCSVFSDASIVGRLVRVGLRRAGSHGVALVNSPLNQRLDSNAPRAENDA